MHRNTYMVINTDSLIHNIDYLKNHNHKEIIPVIKANAYGTCDYYIAKLLQKHNISLLAVSSLDEAINLRLHEVTCDILILGYVDIKDLHLVKEYNLSIITVSEDYTYSIKEDIKDIKFHLKIDSGMHRLGINPKNAKEIFDYLFNKGAIIEGIMTHYACSDEKDNINTKHQFELFKEAYNSINHKFKYIHASNTDASINFHEELTNYIRVGLGLWGYSDYKSELKPCLSLYSEVINVRKLNENEGVGYGLKYKSDGKGYIEVLPIGYADGLIRKNSGGQVYVNNVMGTIVGNICMDQCFIYTDEKCKLHDKVEIFGSHIPLEDVAKRLDTIPYEAITNLSDRINRIFINDSNEIEFVKSPRFESNSYKY